MGQPQPTQGIYGVPDATGPPDPDIFTALVEFLIREGWRESKQDIVERLLKEFEVAKR